MRRSTPTAGFSITELIVVIVLLGLLAAFITIIWPGSSINLHAQAAALANDIRYTQSLAMSRGQRFYLIKTSNNSYQIGYIDGGNSVTIALPSGGSTATLDSHISFGTFTNLPNNLIAFDSEGIPYVDTVSPGTPLTTVVTPSSPTASIQLTTTDGYSSTVSITPETGKVSP